MSISNTFHEPALTTRKPKLTDPKPTGQPTTLLNMRAGYSSANKLTSPVQETADNSPPPSYSVDRAARYKALRQAAQTAAAEASASTNLSGSTISAGGRLTIKTTATERITENMDNAYFSADKGIVEVREAPNIDVTHKKVISTTLESLNSRTKATENATLNMTDTETTAFANIVINQQATNTLKVTETKAIIFAGNDVETTRDAKQVIRVVDGQPMPEASHD